MANITLIVTDAGNAAFTAAINSGSSVDINRIAFGDDGTAHDATSIELGNQIRAFLIESIVRNGTTITFKVTLPASWGGYVLREIGVLSVAGDLLAVGNMLLDKPAPSSGVGFTATLQLDLVLADVTAVSEIVAGVVDDVNNELVDIETARNETLEAKDLVVASVATAQALRDEVFSETSNSANAAPENSNYRFEGDVLKLRDVGAQPGWRKIWLVDGAMQFGDADPAVAAFGKVQAMSDDSNYRFENGIFKIRETAPVAGWRQCWLVDGDLKFGDVEPDV